MGMPIDIAARKILALLHDPPFKPLLFAASSRRDVAELVRYVIGVKEIHYRGEIEEHHERLARYIIDELVRRLAQSGKYDLSGKIKSMQEECRPLVERCDHASSSIDRSIAYLFFSGGLGDRRFVNRLVFKHPLDLSECEFTDKVRRLLYDGDGNLRLNEFASAVNKFISLISEAMIKAESGYEYHALWRTLPAFYVYSLEKAFNCEVPEATLLPADTRSPTSTIIDHLYATSSLTTAITDSEVGLIYWEVENKQEFISTARLPRDLWSGSYLISLTTFYVLMKIADELGPDSIIRPLLHNAPLYDTYLSTRGISIDLSAVIGKNELELPIIPGAALVIVPGKEVENYASKILQWYLDVWNKISEVFIEKLKHLRQKIEGDSKLVELVGDEDEWRKLVLEPPFNVNIAYLKIPWQKSDRDKLMEELFSKNIINSEDLESIRIIKWIEEKNLEGRGTLGESFYEWGLLIRVLTRLHSSLSQTKTITSFEEVNVSDRTRLCTVCWRRRAILSLAKIEETGASPEKFRDLIRELHREGVWIKDGERLCFHCIVRRSLYTALYEVLGKIIQRRLDKEGIKRDDHYPSTEEIAGLAFASTLAAIASSDIDRNMYVELIRTLNDNIIKKYNEIFREDLQTIHEGDREFGNVFTILRKALPSLYEEHYFRVSGVSELSKVSEEVVNSLRRFRESFLELINNWRNNLRAWNPSGLIKLLSNMKAGSAPAIVRWPSDYLALMKGDGDFIGDALSGRGYYEKRVIEMIPSLLMDYVSGLGSEDVGKIDADKIDRLVWLPGLSYTYTISRALMVNSIKASKVIQDYGGLVIYSGGDDVLAMLPPEVTISIVGRLRKDYSSTFIEFEDNVLGKEKIRYKIPGLGTKSSQSFGVLFFDAFFPLKLVVEEVSSLIEEAKEVECLSGVKDSIAISYGVGGLKSYISFKLIETDRLTRLLTCLAFSASLQSGNMGVMKDGDSYIIVDGFSERILRFRKVHEREVLDVFIAQARRAGVSEKMINELKQFFDRSLLINKESTNLLTELIKASLCQTLAIRESSPIALRC
jgi:CRISPR-associated protein Cas10/Cmr2 subtype III-B